MSVRNSEMALFCMFNLSHAPVLTRLAPLCVRPACLSRFPSFSSERFNQKCRKILKTYRRSAATAVRPCQSGKFHIFYWQLICFPKELNDLLCHLFNPIIKLKGAFWRKTNKQTNQKWTNTLTKHNRVQVMCCSYSELKRHHRCSLHGRTLLLIFLFILNRVFLTVCENTKCVTLSSCSRSKMFF